MKKIILIALAVALCAGFSGAVRADVPRPAPNFGIEGVAKGSSLRSFRGQAVVLVIARRARDKYFREEVRRLRALYPQFSTEKVIFVAAIEDGTDEVPSDIPFVTAVNPAQVAADYGASGRFAIAVIGVDGNLDLITQKLVAAERIRDAVFNNFQSQTGSRKQIPLM
jgi:hypothetical protein